MKLPSATIALTLLAGLAVVVSGETLFFVIAAFIVGSAIDGERPLTQG